MNTEWKELKGIVEVAEAVAAGMEIECFTFTDWVPWYGTAWHAENKYRARHLKPAKVQVKSFCWRHKEGYLSWVGMEYKSFGPDWKRFAAGDIPGEVES
jgi:hypothetical protein